MLQRLPRFAAVLLLTTSGCSSPPEIHWEGEHVRLGSEEPSAVCEGTYAFLDERTAALKARTGATHTVDYYWVPSGVGPFCPKGVGVVGCVDGHVIFSEWIPHEHELVHAVSRGMPRVLEEGLATHWGDPWPIHQMAPREDLEAMLMGDAQISTRGDYARSAHFMAFLAETYGKELLIDLERELARDASPGQVSDTLAELVGDTSTKRSLLTRTTPSASASST